MVKSLFIASFTLLLFSFTIAQDEVYIKNNLLSGRLTLSPTTSLTSSANYFFLHGNLEAYLSPQISIIGEGYYFLNELKNNNLQTFKHNHSIFFGANWHFTKENNDFYFGFQPGLSITKLNHEKINTTSSKSGINPLISGNIGYNYYVHQNFHFFIQTKLVIGQHSYDKVENLNEFRFSAGLGFNINTSKKELPK